MKKQHLSWASKKPMPMARSHCPITSYKGKIYLFGGGGPDFKSLDSVIAYNPDNETWEKCTKMPTLRSGAVAITRNNKIYVMGGGFKQADGNFKFLKAVEIYDPESDSWETGPDLLMPHDYPATATLGNYIYVLGGHHPDATRGGPKTDPGFDFCERLNLETNIWEELPSLPTARFALAAVTCDEKIHVMGGVAFTKEGFNNFTCIETFDPINHSWQTDTSFELPWPAAGHGAATLNGNIYVFGGYSNDDIGDHGAAYNMKTKTWQKLPPMPTPRAAMGVTTTDNAIYIMGGWADDGRTPIADIAALEV